MSDYPRSLREFEACFPDDEACGRWLSKKRWSDGFICPACGHGKGFELGREMLMYQCAGCRKQTSVTGSTVLHRSHLPLKVWFLAAWLLVTHRNGISAHQGMLDAARRKGETHTDAASRLELIEGDIMAFDLDRKFPLALTPFSTFQHLTTPDQQRACLTSVHRHLTSGGHLVLDVFDPILDACVPGASMPNPDREAIEPATGHILRRRSIERINDPRSQTFVETFRLERFDASNVMLDSEDATHHLRWAML